MKRTILVGKGRRVTLEELQSLAVDKGATLQLVVSEELEESTPTEFNVSAALSKLSLNDGSPTLSLSVSIVTLTLLAFSVAQGRFSSVKNSSEVVSALVDLVNGIVDAGDAVQPIPSDPGSLISVLKEYCESVKSCISDQLVARCIELATASMDIVCAFNLASLATPVGALSAERTSVNIAAFAEVHFDTNRPHKGLVTAAAALRAILNGSKYATLRKGLSNSNPSESIPQQNGPSLESLKGVYKTMELEINCFPSSASEVMDNTVVTLALKQAMDAIVMLDAASRQRTSTAPTEFTTLTAAVQSFKDALEIECSLGCAFVTDETKRVAEEARQKEAAKTARAAASSTGQTSNANEFDGLSEAQIAKIKKKRAEKEAKAKKKAASKQSSKSPFGSGTLPIVQILQSSPLSSQDTLRQVQAIVEKLQSGGAQRKPKIAKGTRDYLPEQMMIRQQAFGIIRRVFESHGAVEIDTPVFELKETLTGKYGEDSKLIYDLADQGGEMLALRYDLTVPFARFLALNSVGNIKRFHIGKVYRRDQPALARGRYREFYQCDFDIAGNYGRMVPDAECLAVVCDILDALPIGDFGIKLNHRRLLDAILDLSGVPADKFRTICSAVDKLDKEPWEEVKREMVQDKGLQPEVADKIGEFVLNKGDPFALYNELTDNERFGKHAGALEAMEDLRILFDYLDAMGKLQFISFDLSLARGLDYYTGVIYEAVCMSGNTQVGSIGGGGRYDNLVSMFQEAGKVTPCVGVSVGIERVFTLMEARLREEQGGSIKQPNVKVLVATVGEGMMKERMEVAKILWNSNISAEFSQQDNPKLKYEITNALDRAIPYMAIVGEEEAREGNCKLKDLNAKTEETVSLTELPATLRKKGVLPVGCEFAAELLQSEGSM